MGNSANAKKKHHTQAQNTAKFKYGRRALTGQTFQGRPPRNLARPKTACHKGETGHWEGLQNWRRSVGPRHHLPPNGIWWVNAKRIVGVGRIDSTPYGYLERLCLGQSARNSLLVPWANFGMTRWHIWAEQRS